jgi:hypothetical protein
LYLVLQEEGYILNMKTRDFKLPVEASREVAMAIIDQLPQDEFLKVVEDIKAKSRDRSLNSLRKLRGAVKKSGLRKKDFDEALKDVREQKSKKTPCHRS